MRENLSIKQIRKIMGWSYPTAFKFARANGEMVEGKWYVPAPAVKEIVDNTLGAAAHMQERYEVEVSNVR